MLQPNLVVATFTVVMAHFFCGSLFLDHARTCCSAQFGISLNLMLLKKNPTEINVIHGQPNSTYRKSLFSNAAVWAMLHSKGIFAVGGLLGVSPSSCNESEIHSVCVQQVRDIADASSY